MSLLLSVAALQLHNTETLRNNVIRSGMMDPGAGIGVDGATNTIHKDGMMHIECLQDEMYEEADKYGENKHGYTNKFNVSIVRYADVTDREKKRPMTPQVCFDFCRTIHDMHFFGLKEGRTCYCTPYYHRKPGGGGVCDLPCEGDSAKMCGGKEMIDMYEMHMCANTAEDLANATNKGLKEYGYAHAAGIWGEEAAAKFEEAANTLKEEAADLGDMNSHDLGQKMKVHAGTVLHTAERALAAATKLQDELTVAAGLNPDFTKADNVYAAEECIRKLKVLSDEADAAGKEAHKVNHAFFPPINGEQAAEGSGLFVGVMDMIHRWQADHKDLKGATNASHAILYPTTCTGEFATDPKVGLTLEQCAEACNTHSHSGADDYCVGYQHFYMGDLELAPAGTSNYEDCEDYKGYLWYGMTCQDSVDWITWAHDMFQQRYDWYVERGYCFVSDCPYYYYLFNKRDYYFGIDNENFPGGGGYVSYYASWSFPWRYYDESFVHPYKNSLGYDNYYYYTPLADACCAFGGGINKRVITPDAGLCTLFKSIDHVYKYDCGEPEECVDHDYNEDKREGSSLQRDCQAYVENPSLTANMMVWLRDYRDRDVWDQWGAYHLNGWTFGWMNAGQQINNRPGTTELIGPPFYEACCEIKAAYPDGLDSVEMPQLGKRLKMFLELANQTNAPGNVTKALLSHQKKHKAKEASKQEQARARKHFSRKAQKESEGEQAVLALSDPPDVLTTANVCKVRASWMIAAPQKPEFENLNTCLDTGNLVLGNSATGKKKKK